MATEKIAEILEEVKRLAKKYKELTGKPLGVTGEVAEFSASQILGLELTGARQPGYDAIKEVDGKIAKYQIKGRCKKDGFKGRVGSINKEKEFDFVLLVLMDDDFEVLSIYEADRKKIIETLDSPGSISRNIRRQLSISKFKSISREIWSRVSQDKKL